MWFVISKMCFKKRSEYQFNNNARTVFIYIYVCVCVIFTMITYTFDHVLRQSKNTNI